MSWNYRVMEFEDEFEGKYYEIKEVYYNRDGTLMGYCDASVSGGSFSDIIGTLDAMKTDAHKTVLKPSDFCEEALEQQEIGDAEIKQMLNDIEYYQKRVEELEQPLQECKFCKQREVNFDDEPEPKDPLCKICGKVLGSTQECAWTGCPLNWGDESRTDVIGQNGNDGLHYEETKDGS
jgi:hypothetical protein